MIRPRQSANTRSRWTAIGIAWLLPAFLAVSATPALSSGRADPHLLPATARYTRNATCSPVSIAMPTSSHWASDGNDISPYPPLMPLFQGDTAMCFAYATADMISQRLQVVVSPLDVATKYYFTDASRLASIHNPDLQRYLRAAGDYQDKVQQSRIAADVSRDRNPQHIPYIDKLEGGEEDIASLVYNVGGLCEDRALPSYDGFKFHAAFVAHLRVSSRFLPAPKICFSALAGAPAGLRSPASDWFNAQWIDYTSRLCHRSPIAVPLLPVSYRVAANERDIMDMIDEGHPPDRRSVARMFSMIDYALDHRRAPAVGYSFWVFEERPVTDPDITADHSSVVIGRRRVGNTCQYRVQDNTGEYCSHMRGPIRARCDNGRVWLTQDELQHTLYSVTYLR